MTRKFVSRKAHVPRSRDSKRIRRTSQYSTTSVVRLQHLYKTKVRKSCHPYLLPGESPVPIKGLRKSMSPTVNSPISDRYFLGDYYVTACRERPGVTTTGTRHETQTSTWCSGPTSSEALPSRRPAPKKGGTSPEWPSVSTGACTTPCGSLGVRLRVGPSPGVPSSRIALVSSRDPTVPTTGVGTVTRPTTVPTYLLARRSVFSSSQWSRGGSGWVRGYGRSVRVRYDETTTRGRLRCLIRRWISLPALGFRPVCQGDFSLYATQGPTPEVLGGPEGRETEGTPCDTGVVPSRCTPADSQCVGAPRGPSSVFDGSPFWVALRSCRDQSVRLLLSVRRVLQHENSDFPSGPYTHRHTVRPVTVKDPRREGRSGGKKTVESLKYPTHNGPEMTLLWLQILLTH